MSTGTTFIMEARDLQEPSTAIAVGKQTGGLFVKQTKCDPSATQFLSRADSRLFPSFGVLSLDSLRLNS